MKLKYIVLLSVIIIATIAVFGCGEGEAAEDGDTVYVHYMGTLNDGSQFDSSIGKDPLKFVLGAGNMISGFENAVRGMKVGETKTVTLSPDEAYGQHREELMLKISRDELPEGQEPQVGQILRITQSNGQTIQKPIVEVTETYIIVDVNHELAGKELTFKIELVKIETAE
jgi:peptidylprolyl isomerase